MLSIIVCIAQNNAIGLNGGMIYHQRADLKRFKELTTGHTVIMGRRTFESLPKGALPNRRNIVLTRGGGEFAVLLATRGLTTLWSRRACICDRWQFGL